MGGSKAHGYTTPELCTLNADQTNWLAPRVLGCGECRGIGGIRFPPKVGSYASTLAHYEAALGVDLPRAATWPGRVRRTRLLVLFQDPRGVPRFPIADPRRDPCDLGDEHRYFLLSPLAWKALRLDEATGSGTPTWPTEETAHLFLRRYFGVGPGGRAWAYDGFISFFLWFLQPADAYIANVAKCFFGNERSQPHDVFVTCARHHLRREVEAFEPNLVLSFTALVGTPDDLSALTGATARPRAVLRVIHPAAPMSAARKHEALSGRLRANRSGLSDLGYDVDALTAAWTRCRRLALS